MRSAVFMFIRRDPRMPKLKVDLLPFQLANVTLSQACGDREQGHVSEVRGEVGQEPPEFLLRERSDPAILLPKQRHLGDVGHPFPFVAGLAQHAANNSQISVRRGLSGELGSRRLYPVDQGAVDLVEVLAAPAWGRASSSIDLSRSWLRLWAVSSRNFRTASSHG